MAKVRSPNYPAMSLGPALEAVRPAYVKENRNKMSRTVLAKHMGYSSLNGRALGKIGAVRAYGLVDGSGDELRISDDAVVALNAPAGSTDRTAALGRLANKPTLFQELTKDFPTIPSLDNLKFTLIKKGFTPEAAEKAAKSYLATFNLVSGIQDDYNPPEEEDETDMKEAQARPKDILDTPASAVKRPAIIPENFILDEGPVTLSAPSVLSPDSYQDLADRIEIWLRGLKRRSDAEAALKQ